MQSQGMDDLLALLKDHAVEDTWGLNNNGVVIVATAKVEPGTLSAQDAYEAASTLVQVLLGAGYTLVNRADIGAQNDGGVWRGSINVCLRPTDDVDRHTPISLA
jgi:hypothetical protein